jgi:hypothetical protein
MPEPEPPRMVEVDARHRVSLGALTTPHARYLASAEPGGVIVLTPAVVLPATPAAAAADRFLADPSAGTRRTRPEGHRDD